MKDLFTLVFTLERVSVFNLALRKLHEFSFGLILRTLGNLIPRISITQINLYLWTWVP